MRGTKHKKLSYVGCLTQNVQRNQATGITKASMYCIKNRFTILYIYIERERQICCDIFSSIFTRLLFTHFLHNETPHSYRQMPAYLTKKLFLLIGPAYSSRFSFQRKYMATLCPAMLPAVGGPH